MSDEPHRTPAVPLERPGRLRPSWLRRLTRLAVVVCLSAAIIEGRSNIALVDRGSSTALVDREHVCADAAHDACADAVRGARPDAAQVCQRELQRTQDPKTRFYWAEALEIDGDFAGAKRTAETLLQTPQRSDALYLLGLIARDEDRNVDAMTALEEARKLHRIEKCPGPLARDDGMLAMIRTDRSEFPEALLLIDDCITQAQLAGDMRLQHYCHVTAVKTLIRVGYWPAAEQEIKNATPAASDDERSDLAYQRGSYEQELGQDGSAIAMFEKALQYGKHSQSWTINTELDLAYSLAKQGRVNDAQHYFEDATRLDSENKKEPERTWVAARIAYRQHDLTRAASLVEKYFKLVDPDDPDEPVDRDDRIDVAILGAQIELERGNLGIAERWGRRGVEQAEGVRRTQSVLELRPWVLTKRRAAYELLFTALARSRQFEAAAMAFDAWQGRTVQDALARPRPSTSLDYRGMADQVTRLDRWLSAATQAPIAKSPDPDAVLRTMGDIDLLALIVANGDVWRLTANHGPPQLVRVGALAKIQDLVDHFRGHPTTDIKRASDLGELLLPDDAFRATREVLHVLVDGQLAGLPVAALRQGDTPLIALRPIVRVLRLPKSRCVPMARPGHATVLGAPDATLPNAQQEAEQIAALLHTTSETGAAATRAALVDAKNDAVLHVAAHGKIGMDGAAIMLAGGEMISALEISALRVAPSLAVLSACDAATADDLELAGSLAAGFLGAGSQHVVATLRPITDAGALEISTRFYREGGVADPAHALQAAQAALVKSDNVDWPYFTVFGADVCPEGTPDHQ